MLELFKSLAKTKAPPKPTPLRETSIGASDDDTMILMEAPSLPKKAQQLKADKTDGEGFPVADCGGMVNQIGYIDAKGEKSERLVTFFRISTRAGRWHLQGLCHDRDAFRSFRCDRILYCLDPETGEMQEDFFAYMADIFGVEAQSWQDGAEDNALKYSKDGARVLLFLANCDGEYHPLEREVICEYVNRRCGALGIPGNITGVMRFIDNSTADKYVYYDSLDNLMEENDAGHIRLLMQMAVRLTEADGFIKSEESQWIADLKAELD